MKEYEVFIKTTFWRSTTIKAKSLSEAKKVAADIDGIDTDDFETEIRVSEKR